MTLGNAISPGLRRVLWALMALTVLVNAASMFTPIINEGDSVLYAALAQHMVDSGDWLSLVLDGWARGDAELHAELCRDHRGERGLADARRTREQEVIERAAATARGRDRPAEVGDHFALADEVVE